MSTWRTTGYCNIFKFIELFNDLWYGMVDVYDGSVRVQLRIGTMSLARQTLRAGIETSLIH